LSAGPGTFMGLPLEVANALHAVGQLPHTRSGRPASHAMKLTRLWVALLPLLLGSCSLISIKTPDKPLSTRDLNTRILTRQFAADYLLAVRQCADQIAAQDADPEVQRNALRWKIAVAEQSQSAAMQLAPAMALLDTWSVAAGMQQFFAPGGAGATLFGTEQAQVVAVSERWNTAAAAMAQELLTPRDFQSYGQFVREYLEQYPPASLEDARPSVVRLWVARVGAATPILDSTGTIPQALADTSDRLQMMATTLPAQTGWQGQLALETAGFSGPEMREALKHLDERLAHLTDVAQNSPQLVREAVSEVRISLLEVIDRLDASSAATLQTLRTERLELSATISSERAAILLAADEQRKAITHDVADISHQLLLTAGAEARRLTWILGLVALLLALLIFGLPFAAGYLVGRSRARARSN
jgi:hypothetical protein